MSHIRYGVDVKTPAKNSIRMRDFFLPANLVSMSRVILTPIIGYYLWQSGDQGVTTAALLIAIAGLTDFLDGLLARKLNQVTALGLFLDPVADKLFALMLIIELIFFRAFPIWLAIAVIARDLAILIGGSVILKNTKLIPPSNFWGKYYFASLVFLIGSYVIYFDFGISLFFLITVTLLLISSIDYLLLFLSIKFHKPLNLILSSNGIKLPFAAAWFAAVAIFLWHLSAFITS